MKLRILLAATALAAMFSTPVRASAQAWQYGARNVTGVISSVQGSSLTLNNGLTVFLHQGTVINPTGTMLQPGMEITIAGGPGGNNAVNANEIDVNATAYQPYGYNGGYNNGYSNGYNNGYGYQAPYYGGGPTYVAPAPVYVAPPVYLGPRTYVVPRTYVRPPVYVRPPDYGRPGYRPPYNPPHYAPDRHTMDHPQHAAPPPHNWADTHRH